MSEKNNNSEMKLLKPLDFEEKRKHLDTGYSNSQAVVRFLDTKAAAVIGVVPIVLGVVAGIFSWLQKAWDWNITVRVLGMWAVIAYALVMVLLASALLLFAWHTIIAAFTAIKPRDTKGAAPSLLFPIAASATSPQTFESRVLQFLGDPTENDLLEDYRRQLVRMSEIVTEKMTYVDRAVDSLKKVFFLAALSIAVMILVNAIGAIVWASVIPRP